MGGGESSSLHLCNDGAETSTGPSDVVLELSPKPLSGLIHIRPLDIIN
jgi:hypothetical protein